MFDVRLIKSATLIKTIIIKRLIIHNFNIEKQKAKQSKTSLILRTKTFHYSFISNKYIFYPQTADSVRLRNVWKRDKRSEKKYTNIGRKCGEQKANRTRFNPVRPSFWRLGWEKIEFIIVCIWVTCYFHTKKRGRNRISQSTDTIASIVDYGCAGNGVFYSMCCEVFTRRGGKRTVWRRLCLWIDGNGIKSHLSACLL